MKHALERPRVQVKPFWNVLFLGTRERSLSNWTCQLVVQKVDNLKSVHVQARLSDNQSLLIFRWPWRIFQWVAFALDFFFLAPIYYVRWLATPVVDSSLVKSQKRSEQKWENHATVDSSRKIEFGSSSFDCLCGFMSTAHNRCFLFGRFRHCIWTHPWRPLLPRSTQTKQLATFAEEWGRNHQKLNHRYRTLLEEQKSRPPRHCNSKRVFQRPWNSCHHLPQGQHASRNPTSHCPLSWQS